MLDDGRIDGEFIWASRSLLRGRFRAQGAKDGGLSIVSMVSLYTGRDRDEKETYNYGIVPSFGSAVLVLLDFIEG